MLGVPGVAVRYDTSSTAVRKASAEKEKEVFSDKDFIYHADAKESKNWFRAFIEWLTEQFFGKVSAQNVELTWQVVKWTAIGLFIGGIIFVLWKSKFRGLLRSDPKILAGASFADLPEDLESVNIERHIEDAIRNGNYRLAIRWCFLKSLQLLNQKKQIAWQPYKTNVDYEYELKNSDLRERFSKLSHVFEYVWYGELATNEATFNKYRGDVDKFNASIHG
jgi:hypothetical protein